MKLNTITKKVNLMKNTVDIYKATNSGINLNSLN